MLDEFWIMSHCNLRLSCYENTMSNIVKGNEFRFKIFFSWQCIVLRERIIEGEGKEINRLDLDMLENS